jgi:uncharacterized repeat protein (TIGR02543 family)
MQRVAKKATAIVATAAAVGFSSLFLAAAPATAAPVTCGNGATMLTGGICELTVTATGPTVFAPTAEVSQLEALLVAGGGSGAYAAQGYGAGGGGEVKVVGFADTVTPIGLTVGAADTDTTATQGAVVETAAAGNSAGTSSSGGSSGNGNTGAAGIAGANGAGGGAGGPAPDQATGGVGATAASVAPAGSHFTGDSTCYGGGGASSTPPTTAGAASCGGGFVTLVGTGFVATAPTPNFGGGGSTGASSTTFTPELEGASGVVVLRWVAVGATVTFDTAGRGTAVAPQTVAFGTTVTQPADPTAAGFTFDGWFTDATFTTRVDFSAPVGASTTYYASFTPVPTVTVSFDTGGRGAAIAPQTVPSGSPVTRPADPVAAGFTFNGWFSNAAFTTPVDFTAPVTASATYYASFTAVAAPAPVLPTPAQPAVVAPAAPVAPVVSTPAPATRALAVTGGTVDTTALAAGLAALAAGAGLLAVAARRTRRVR